MKYLSVKFSLPQLEKKKRNKILCVTFSKQIKKLKTFITHLKPSHMIIKKFCKKNAFL